MIINPKMAFNSFLWRASASASNSILGSHHRHLIMIGGCSQFLRFSTATPYHFLRMIESSYTAHQSSNNAKEEIMYIPEEFPFENMDFGSYLSLRSNYDQNHERIHIDIRSIAPEYFYMTANTSKGTRVMHSNFDHTKIKPDKISLSDSQGGHLEAFEDFLKIRGIDMSMMNFLSNKFQKEFEEKKETECKN